MRSVQRDFSTSGLRQMLVWLVALKCAGLVLLFEPSSLSAFDLPKSVFSRATEWLLVGVIGLSLLTFGLRIVPRTRLHIAIGVLLAANVAATMFAANTFIATYGDAERYQGLAFVVDMAILYAAVAIGYRRAADWTFLGTLGALTSVLVMAYAAAQRLGVDPIPWVLRSSDRPFASLGHPDMLGHLLSIGFGISLGVGAFALGRIRNLVRIAAVALVVSFAAVAGIVATRSSLLGFSAAAAVGAVLYLQPRPPLAWLRRLILGGVAVAVVAGLLALSPIAERTRATTLVGLGVEQRLSIYRTAVAAFEQRPVFGYGPDSFSIAHPANRDDKDALIQRRVSQSSAHSWVLHALATTGAVGLASLGVVIVAAGWILWRRLREREWLAAPLLMGLAAYWADGLVTVGAVGVDWFPWVAFGGAAALSGEHTDPMPALRRIPRLATVAIGTIATVGALSGLIALSAGEEAWQARLLVLRGSVAAVEHAERAVTLDPGRAEYWNWLGQAREIANDLHAASDAYAEATRRQPYNAKFWGSLAKSLSRQALAADTSRGGGPAAIAAARRGVDEDPNNPEASAVLADMAARFGQGDVAVGAAATAVVLYPIDAAYDRLLLRSSRAASDLRAAAAQVARALAVKDSALVRVAAGELALRLGDNAAARGHATRAAQLAPNDPDVRALVTRLARI